MFAAKHMRWWGGFLADLQPFLKLGHAVLSLYFFHLINVFLVHETLHIIELTCRVGKSIFLGSSYFGLTLACPQRFLGFWDWLEPNTLFAFWLPPCPRVLPSKKYIHCIDVNPQNVDYYRFSSKMLQKTQNSVCRQNKESVKVGAPSITKRLPALRYSKALSG